MMRSTPLKPIAFRPQIKPSHRQATGKLRIWKSAKEPRGNGEDQLCHGQQCYVLIPGICCNDASTVVPAHSNQLIHGKGKGIKALDKYTVPACWKCHAEIDQGMRFTREEKFRFWNEAYAKWAPIRDELMGFLKKLGA